MTVNFHRHLPCYLINERGRERIVFPIKNVCSLAVLTHDSISP